MDMNMSIIAELNTMRKIATRSGTSKFGQQIIMHTYRDEDHNICMVFSVDGSWINEIYYYDHFNNLMELGEIPE